MEFVLPPEADILLSDSFSVNDLRALWNFHALRSRQKSTLQLPGKAERFWLPNGGCRANFTFLRRP